MKHYRVKELTWTRVVYSCGGTWSCEEWVCDQYPDLRNRVHMQNGSKNEFYQFMLRGDHGVRHPSLKKAFRALMKRKAIRIGNVNKIQPRRVTRKHRTTHS
jgi:hypothetical protein